ncbi:MAG TPA: hypothetical protein VGH57_28355 [Amycolatopsis sp.]
MPAEQHRRHPRAEDDDQRDGRQHRVRQVVQITQRQEQRPAERGDRVDLPAHHRRHPPQDRITHEAAADPVDQPDHRGGVVRRPVLHRFGRTGDGEQRERDRVRGLHRQPQPRELRTEGAHQQRGRGTDHEVPGRDQRNRREHAQQHVTEGAAAERGDDRHQHRPEQVQPCPDGVDGPGERASDDADRFQDEHGEDQPLPTEMPMVHGDRRHEE